MSLCLIVGACVPNCVINTYAIIFLFTLSIAPLLLCNLEGNIKTADVRFIHDDRLQLQTVLPGNDLEKKSFTILETLIILILI